ncbi:HAMP domain-containing sensor histidine kinase [Ornithinibacillus xuwenensis]|uniref:histidine kinase n=1 Tax=Ornithinibacillus xuwenensis TaxID=3144668 RepID=A0ABU9XGN7_9BACI
MKKFFRSLLAKYMLIIFLAIILLQLAYLIIAMFTMFGQSFQNSEADKNDTAMIVEEKWHEDANSMEHVNKEVIQNLFNKWKEDYPEAGMFWVNGNGRLAIEIDATEGLPLEWSTGETVKFIKERYDSDPFTVIAFAGEDESNGFIVLEVPRIIFSPPLSQLTEKYGVLLFFGVLAIILLFIIISFLFFRRIQKRLIQLQDAMELRDVDGLPIEVKVKKKDEIGQLELSFNQMVFEIRESRKREQEEEQLRRELIANLSHDLRTPLTKVRAQSYTIMKEDLSVEGKHAVKAIESSIANIDRLIENLMSYTLLMASKYKYAPKETDVTRFLREFIATWYPAFEKEGFEIDVSISSVGKWRIDPTWMGRILDNLFQNVLRHAKEGKYIGVKTESSIHSDAIIICDRGQGFQQESQEKGAGIGLTIVDRMINGMNLEWTINSKDNGTLIRIERFK